MGNQKATSMANQHCIQGNKPTTETKTRAQTGMLAKGIPGGQTSRAIIALEIVKWAWVATKQQWT